MKKLLSLLIILFSVAAFAETAKQPRLWNLQDADILSVINEISAETGKNFVVDSRVNGKISLISSKPINGNEAYHIFLSVLDLLGYSAIPSGSIVKIVPNGESGEQATRVANRKFPGKGDEVVVRVIALENVSANQLVPIIRPMLPQWSNVATYTPGNVIIIMGRAGNINRIIQVIENIDKTTTNDIDIVPLHQAAASQMASVLANLQNAARSSGETPQISIAADERSNSILLSGNKYARLRMKFLINKLDKPTSDKQGNTQVIYLRYLKAKDVAPILSKIALNLQNKNDKTFTTQQAASMANASKNESVTNIQAEPSTNAIVITAPATTIRALSAVVAKLDVRPAQVLIEAILVEIGQDDLKNLGIQWGSQPGSFNFSTPDGSPLNGFPPLGANTFGIIPSTQLQAVLTALRAKTGVNILSTPSIVVLDNHKAMLGVGKNIATQSGSYATTGQTSTVTPYNTVNRTDVELKLEVTPQINLGNAVRLDIKLVNDTLQNPDNPGLNPIINKSNISNNVIVNSQNVLVLGGLTSNTLNDSVDKVAILGDLPILGNLFQHKVRKLEKKNLMVFIKPTILHNAEQATNITHVKYNDVREAQINWPVDLSSVAEQKRQNILPKWNHQVVLPKPFDKTPKA